MASRQACPVRLATPPQPDLGNAIRHAAKQLPANPGRGQIAPGSNTANNFIMRITFFKRGAPPPGPHPTKAGPCFAGPGPIARALRRAPPRNDLDKSQQFKRIKRKPGARIETGRRHRGAKTPGHQSAAGKRGEREGIAPPRRAPSGFDAASPLPAKRAAPRANSSLSARAPQDRFSPHEKTATEKQALRAPAPPTQ